MPPETQAPTAQCYGETATASPVPSKADVVSSSADPTRELPNLMLLPSLPPSLNLESTGAAHLVSLVDRPAPSQQQSCALKHTPVVPKVAKKRHLPLLSLSLS